MFVKASTSLLLVIDYFVNLGFVSLWNIENYCVSTSASYPPKRMSMAVVGKSV